MVQLSMLDEAGVPELTAYDRCVLRSLDDQRFLDLWDIGRRLQATDLAELRRILAGLAHLGLVRAVPQRDQRKWAKA